MVFTATFNNISVIPWWSVLLVEETRGHREKPRPVVSHWQTLSHNVLSSTPHHGFGVLLYDCIDEVKIDFKILINVH